MDTLADSPLIPASILFSIPSAHPPTQGSGSSVYALQVMCGIWPMASLVFHFVYAPVRTGHLAREWPISYSFSLYLYSWYSGLVTLIFRTFLMLGGYKFRVVDGLYWYTLRA